MQGTRGQIRSGGDSGAESDRHAADADAARALFRHRHGRRRRHRGGELRYSGLRRHRARDGGGLEQGQGRQGAGDVIVRDPVVLTATLPRFLRTGDRGTVQLELDNVEGAAGDYNVAARERRRRQTRQRQTGDPQARRQAARPSAVAVSAAGAGTSAIKVSVTGPNGFTLDAPLCARRAAGDADPDAAHRAAARARRDADAVERHVRRPRAGHRPRRPVGRDLDRARRRDAAERARPLSVRLLRADHQPRAAAALCQRARRAGPARARRRHRPAHPGRHRAAAGAAGFERLVRPVVGRRRRSLARRLCHRLPHPRARARFRGAGAGVHPGARPAAQFRGEYARRRQERRPRSRLCALRAGAQRRGAGRRPALHRRHQARRHRDADRQGADRRRARHARRQDRAPSASISPRSMPISPQPSSISAASTTARRCAIGARW